jgi:hypothetical protein
MVSKLKNALLKNMRNMTYVLPLDPLNVLNTRDSK